MLNVELLSLFRRTLLVKDGSFEIPEDWGERDFRSELENYKNKIEDILPSVGRIILSNHPTIRNVAGTGWLIADDVVVTNAHVANHFSEKSTNGFRFKVGSNGKISANINFKGEHFSDEENTFKVIDILFVDGSGRDESDLAFLKIDKNARDYRNNAITLNAKPLRLNTNDINDVDIVVTIGYPITDGYIDTAIIRLISQSFDTTGSAANSSGHKRIAPGTIIKGVSSNNQFRHDCSTLKGNSGSPVINLKTGEVVGTHSKRISSQNKWNNFIASNLVSEYYEEYA